MKFIAALCVLVLSLPVRAQVGVGVTYGFDVYQHHHNPRMSADTTQFGLGSALFNLNIGPKFWIGGKNFSVGLEAQLGVAPFALDINEYKGLGAFYFPVLFSLNYGGLSGFQEKGRWGAGIAAGTQYTRTDLYFLKEEFEDINRSIYQTYFGQLNLGLGSKASAIYIYVRYAGGDLESHNWHIGLMLDQNLTQRRKLKKRDILGDTPYEDLRK